MARLSDLVNVNINRDSITIQGTPIPVIFTFKSFPYIEEAYGKPYHVFENDINRMLVGKNVRLGKNEIRLMNALIYAMVRSGGTHCTLAEIEGAIPLSDLPGIFQTALNIFNNQNFQKSDMDKIKTEKKN
ncbi:hypothetical protein M670_00129 [Schinkia azotoformans MEV2011]|uniref:Phage protein n=1 Tax=Schinkia azotoformans MEV2011 TaxID=1348973 RepID=A0A072NR39_SCHAZ|nr:hypothetical protein [Schinkia azotoformans]KEF40114.1 hypothetical protein M670_00129 [Schinkia azotoformans MEV2011]